jgi:hypothetical protein
MKLSSRQRGEADVLEQLGDHCHRIGGKAVWLGGNDVAVRQVLENSLSSAHRPAGGPLDVAFVTPLSVDEAVYFACKLKKRFRASGELWIVFASDPSPSADSTDAPIDAEQLIDQLELAGFHKVAAAEMGGEVRWVRFHVAC